MIKVLDNYVLIEPEKMEEVTVGGIVLPQERKDTPQTGIVIDNGGLDLAIGKRVWFKMWSGENIKYENKEYKIVHYKDLLAYEEK
jgi:chaperonin GroES